MPCEIDFIKKEKQNVMTLNENGAQNGNILIL